MFNYQEIVGFIQSVYKTREFIPLHMPHFGGNEKKYILDAIDSTFVSSVGQYVNRFEEMMCQITGSKYAIACVNGTSALHMSLILAGVKKNDLVLTQAVSFIATCNAIKYISAEPLFIDIDKTTLGLCPISLENYLDQNTIIVNDVCIHSVTKQKISACVPMHTFGHPTQIEKIKKICDRYYIPLIEDAAESIGSYYKKQHTGTFGLLGVFSFNGNKTVTSGGGGCIVTNDEHLAKLGKHLSTQSKIPHKWEFVHDNIGYNYRMPNLNAAMACAQLEQLEKYLNSKREIAKKYENHFASTEIHFCKEPENATSNYWLNSILLPNHKSQIDFLQYSNDNGIMTRPIWKMLNKLSMFKDCMKADLSNSNFIEARLVNLPSSVISE